MLNNQLMRRKGPNLYSQYGQFQDSNVVSLKSQLGRDYHNPRSMRPGSTTPLICHRWENQFSCSTLLHVFNSVSPTNVPSKAFCFPEVLLTSLLTIDLLQLNAYIIFYNSLLIFHWGFKCMCSLYHLKAET